MEKRRIVQIDILRGYAMLGVVLINFNEMNLLPGQEGSFTKNLFSTLISTLFFNKSYLIFAFLFGYSLYILEKSLSKYDNNIIRKIIHQRLISLFILGLVQTMFIWWGTILILYSIYGLLIYWLIKKLNYKMKIIISILFLLVAPLTLSLFPNFNFNFLVIWIPELQLTQLQKYYVSGDLLSITQSNLLAWIYDFYGVSGGVNKINYILKLVCYNFQIIGLIMLGYAASEKSIIQKLNPKINIIILGLSVIFYLLISLTNQCLSLDLILIKNLVFTLVTCLIILLISKSNKLSILLYPFSIVGKTAFSFYVLHMTISYCIFYIAKQYQKFDFIQIECLAFFTFCLILTFNFYILKWYKIGIFENILRKLTYIGIPRL